jgi:hypothetical protein
MGDYYMPKFVLPCVKPFDITDFPGGNLFTIWKGSRYKWGKEGQEERDPREDALTEIDWRAVQFNTFRVRKEIWMFGEDYLRLAKETKDIRLGGKSFVSLWENHYQEAPDSLLTFLLRQMKIKRIIFTGLVLRSNEIRDKGKRYALMIWHTGGVWTRSVAPLDTMYRNRVGIPILKPKEQENKNV